MLLFTQTVTPPKSGRPEPHIENMDAEGNRVKASAKDELRFLAEATQDLSWLSVEDR